MEYANTIWTLLFLDKEIGKRQGRDQDFQVGMETCMQGGDCDRESYSL